MAKTLRFEQIFISGDFTSKIHNLTNANPEFEKAEIGDLVMIPSPVKKNYNQYGVVTI